MRTIEDKQESMFSCMSLWERGPKDHPLCEMRQLRTNARLPWYLKNTLKSSDNGWDGQGLWIYLTLSIKAVFIMAVTTYNLI